MTLQHQDRTQLSQTCQTEKHRILENQFKIIQHQSINKNYANQRQQAMPLAKNGVGFVLPMHQHCVLIFLPLASSDLLSKSCNIKQNLHKIYETVYVALLTES